MLWGALWLMSLPGASTSCRLLLATTAQALLLMPFGSLPFALQAPLLQVASHHILQQAGLGRLHEQSLLAHWHEVLALNISGEVYSAFAGQPLMCCSVRPSCWVHQEDGPASACR